MGRQCAFNLDNNGVMWQNFGAQYTILAAALWILSF